VSKSLTNETVPTTSEQERDLRKKRNEVRSVYVSVYKIVPDLKTVIVTSDVGNIQLHLPAHLCPLHLNEINEGQKLVVRLQGILAPKILQVSLAET
jgi:hypothetical protein